MKKLYALIAILMMASTVNAQNFGVQKVGQLSYNIGLNDIWGWTDTATGKEYALVGVIDGLSVVDLSDSTNPKEVFYEQGASSIWRDIKTYKHYAYVVHDSYYNGSSDGIMIVDLNTIGQTFPTVYRRYPSVTVGGTTKTLDRAHNIYIDENGILYLFGGNLGVGGASMFDLTADPTNPKHVGTYAQEYFHDGVARGDTLWGGAIYNGKFSAVDVSVKSNPVRLATQGTPFSFTHNIWFSDDNSRVFTTDERTSAVIAEYDVSDLSNITLLDTIRTSLGTDVIPHNAHFHNGFLVNSYYTSGLQLVDANEPGLMVETGVYDTSPLSGDGFTGAWGAYPYLPSGLILVSDREEGLFVLSSDYPRATYLGVKVTDSVTGSNIIAASVEVLNGDISGQTDLTGSFEAGQAQSGNYQVVVSASGYTNDTINISLAAGQWTRLNVQMVPFDIGLEENQVFANMQYYPNPSEGQLFFHGLDELRGKLSYRVSDLRGQELLKGVIAVQEGSARMNLDLQAGYYLVQLSDGAGHFRTLKVRLR